MSPLRCVHVSWGHKSQSFSISFSPKILTNGSMAGSGLWGLLFKPLSLFPSSQSQASRSLFSIYYPAHNTHTLISTQPIDTDRGMKLRAKGLGLLLLLVLLALCSTIEVTEARRGKHWRSSRSSSQLKKGKGKKSSSRRQYGGGSNRPSSKPPVSSTPSSGAGKGNQNPYQPSPGPSPGAPDIPRPSPANGSRHSTPKPPTPSCGKGHQQPSQPPPATSQGGVFNVVDFGAKGDGVADDTKVDSFALQMLCFKQNLILKLSSVMHSHEPAISSFNSFCEFPLQMLCFKLIFT